MILFTVIALCHDTFLLAYSGSTGMSWHPLTANIKTAINRADELQTSTAIISRLLMDCILIVSANTWATFDMKLYCSLPAAVFSTQSVKTKWLSQLEQG